MYDFIFFTKTFWDEPPRIRQQLAWLLANAGYGILFFEKPSSFLKKTRSPTAVKERITVVGYRELIHHKLRLFPFIHKLNAVVTISSIRGVLHDSTITKQTKIVNFNYEYFFLKDIFPENKIITVINDDHPARALFGHRIPLDNALLKTCNKSDHVLTVSTPLLKKLLHFTSAELFFPWADIPYSPPSHSRRYILLFWGYINRRIDYKLLTLLADQLESEYPDFKILLVGPVNRQNCHGFEKMFSRKNIEIRLPSLLDELPIDNVLAGLILYRDGDSEVSAIEISNKSLQLLARGLPLLISGMPNFIDKPFVFRVRPDNFVCVVRELIHHFHDLQSSIKEFVDKNSAGRRLQQFEKVVR